jgi:hypothetical protein
MPDQVGHSPDDGGVLPGQTRATEEANNSAHVAALFLHSIKSTPPRNDGHAPNQDGPDHEKNEKMY